MQRGDRRSNGRGLGSGSRTGATAKHGKLTQEEAKPIGYYSCNDNFLGRRQNGADARGQGVGRLHNRWQCRDHAAAEVLDGRAFCVPCALCASGCCSV